MDNTTTSFASTLNMDIAIINEYNIFKSFYNNLTNSDTKDKLNKLYTYINNIYQKIENKTITEVLLGHIFDLILHCNNILFAIYQSLDKSNINVELMEIKTVLDKLLEFGGIEKDEYLGIINTLNELIK